MSWLLVIARSEDGSRMNLLIESVVPDFKKRELAELPKCNSTV